MFRTLKITNIVYVGQKIIQTQNNAKTVISVRCEYKIAAYCLEFGSTLHGFFFFSFFWELKLKLELGLR